MHEIPAMAFYRARQPGACPPADAGPAAAAAAGRELQNEDVEHAIFNKMVILLKGMG